ncbi:rhodanese-like domain-containing protein [Candidatus Woesearchaeota archaeon]|nr:rhodanese-like domain-containing protein [Candidatus Woesearchaeota archaeon]
MKNYTSALNRGLRIIYLLFALVLFIGCTQDSNDNSQKSTSLSKNTSYKNMTVDELNQQLKNKDFALVDVHIPEQKHINGTDAFIPYDDIENQLDKLPQGKEAKIVLYCKTGRMSQIAAEKLAERGYTNVYNVVGGIVEWVNKGYGR